MTPDLPTLYAAYLAAQERRALAETGSEAFVQAAKDCHRLKTEARLLSGKHDPFFHLESPGAKNFRPMFGTGRRE
jgi:hypothetical protein